MKKQLFILTAILTTATAVFTGCGMHGDTNGNSVAGSNTALESTLTDELDGKNYETAPKASENDGNNADDGENNEKPEKPHCKKCRKHRPEGFHGTDFLIIRFGHIGKKHDKEALPRPPHTPALPDEPAENENEDNGN